MSGWLEDAHDYSLPGTDHVRVEITSYAGADETTRNIIFATDFVLTPEQAKAMFLALSETE